MTESEMLSKEGFVDFVLKGSSAVAGAAVKPDEGVLPDGLEGFGDEPEATSEVDPGASFARRLLEASGFGYPDMVQRDNVIRGSDAVARHLPARVCYWQKTATRPFQTLLFEAELQHRDLLAISAFKGRKVAHLDMVEDALSRLVAEALEGFQRGGEGVKADVRQGRKEETLCVVSIVDARDVQPVRLVCFGTQNKTTGGLETFVITEQTRLWDPQLAREHLALLYERQFSKLGGRDWQDAFTTTEERKQAEKLLDICTRKAPAEHDIQEGVLDLLDVIAKGFGLRRKPGTQRRLQAFSLPADHDIGIDPEERDSAFGGSNPFGGVTLRDERSRLLGYIVYPLKTKADASRLRKHLAANNRFHNVLVVYPDTEQANLELWQGREQLTGKLRKGQGYEDAADVVNLLSRFFVVSKAKVRNPTELAMELAYRARYLRRLAVKQLQDEPETGPLRNLYNAFREALLHDLSEDKFADAYAQTITYGLLAARWTGNADLVAEGERLTRQTALKHLPASSPFLKEFFKSVLGVRLDEQRGRLLWLVDDIADLLDRVDVEYVFGAGDPESTTARDPVIHFYEPFLNAYDPKLKKELGVFYTPRPVVSYIVRSVHELLQTEFGLADGLADTTTWGEFLKKQPALKLPTTFDDNNKEGPISPNEPFVQILDPATGTATFLVEVIDVIHRTLAAKWKKQRFTDAQQRAAWNDYVPQHLLPRLHAFELMMAPYAIAHMKIGLKLAETGYRFGTEERARIYLTNALEPWVKQLPLIGVDALAHEAAAVNEIKRHKRFTVVIGNPPYSGISANMSKAIVDLVEPYKQINGVSLGERKIWAQDDYKKFIRFSQLKIATTRCGVLGLITNHGFINEPTSRGMRHNLLGTFPRVTVFDLHGSLKKREVCPDGSPDRNVFDIEPGVAISFFRSGGSEQPGVAHGELWGLREKKYDWLLRHTIGTTKWFAASPSPEFYLFAPQNEDTKTEFSQLLSITEVFDSGSNGIQTSRDHVVYGFRRDECRSVIEDFRLPEASLSTNDLREKYWPGKKVANYPSGDTRGWRVQEARKELRRDTEWEAKFRRALYRPLDFKTLFHADYMIDWPRTEVMSQMLRPNLSLCVGRAGSAADNQEWNIIFVANTLVDMNLFYRGGNVSYPLRFAQVSGSLAFDRTPRPNFKGPFLKILSSTLGLPQTKDFDLPAGLTPEDIFHYAYAVFHSPGYRSRYAEFLKIDFPRLPLTGNLELFRALARLGGELTALHLLESPRLDQPITEFIGGRNPKVEKVSWSRGTVWVDKAQTTGFRGVREPVWNFHVGGYQVCEKWLKDRKGRTLTKDDVAHYQKIVVALSETIQLMAEIDKVIEKHGGWPNAFVTKETGANQ